MRKLVLSMRVSLDGLVARPGRTCRRPADSTWQGLVGNGRPTSKVVV